jgi:ABC-type proline/glycine betaine transport system permease subunit
MTAATAMAESVRLSMLNRTSRVVRAPGAERAVAVGVALTCAVAVVDALLGSRIVLVGLLVIGPACTAVSIWPGATLAVSVLAVALAVVLGIPDGVWASAQHHVFTGAVLLVGGVSTAAVFLVSRSTRPSEGAVVLAMADRTHRRDDRPRRG